MKKKKEIEVKKDTFRQVQDSKNPGDVHAAGKLGIHHLQVEGNMVEMEETSSTSNMFDFEMAVADKGIQKAKKKWPKRAKPPGFRLITLAHFLTGNLMPDNYV